VTASGTPDVTVVVAVYNTMPYLTRCLTSVVEQTIGRDRLEVIAVDDGSTDGSAAELDRLAETYPDTVQVIHQANSGGPAAPSNRALARATGRYVFFLGADDYLGREALERLVAAADEYGSDVTLGRLVGVNGRYVHQAIFAESAVDVDVFDSPLPWSMSNTKLFRRELIDRHGLRFPEDMPMLSDQPFTIEACLRAERISVLVDYGFYYAVRRLDASNITFRPRHEELLRCTNRLMDVVAELVEPGKQRDALLVRHFSWEVAKLFRRDFLRLERPVQERLRAGVGALAERYLTDEIARQLGVWKRLLFRVAQHGTVDELTTLLRYEVEHGDPPVTVDGDRWYARYPGFRDPAVGRPDDWFDVTEDAANWLAKLDATKVSWSSARRGRRALLVTAHSSVPRLAEWLVDSIQMTAGGAHGTTVETGPAGDGTRVRVRFDVRDLLPAEPDHSDVRTLRTHVRTASGAGVSALASHVGATTGRLIARRGTRLYVLKATTNHNGRLIVAITPVTLRRVVGRLRRVLPGLRRGSHRGGSTT
jgi:glycosyltransferase involved in cell wall biosynthesis